MAVSIIIGTAVYLYFKSLACGIASFLAGVLIDIDHIFDCYLNHGTHFKLKDIYNYCMEVKFDKLTFIFHSYELLAILWAMTLIFSFGNIWKAVAIGLTQHIIFDQIVNTHIRKMEPLAYFFIYRLRNRFKKEEIVKER